MAKPTTLFGFHRDSIEITGDVVSPVEVDWEALDCRPATDLTVSR